MIAEAATWDPCVGYGAGSSTITLNIYEGLVGIDLLEDGTWTFFPKLAKSWVESDNHTTWTFELRENVLFHDGTKFNSSAVLFWFERMLGVGRGPAWIFSEYYDRVVPVDTYTVKIHLKRPTPSFDVKCILSNAFGSSGIMSPTYVKSHSTPEDPWAEDWMYDHTCGTGPYMLDHVDHGVESVWLKFPEYWGGWEGDHLDKIEFRVIPDLQVQMMHFFAGEVDSFNAPRDQIAGVLDEFPEAKLWWDTEFLAVIYTYMDMRRPELQDINVRKAISYAFDYEGVIEHVYHGYAWPAHGPVAHGIPNHDPDVFTYTYDLDKAKEYMAKSAYPDGFTATIGPQPGSREQIAEVFQQNMAEIGITVEIQSVPYSVLWEMMQDPETSLDFSIANWFPDFPTFDSAFTPSLGPIEYSWQNWSFYNSSEVRTLLEDARYEFNETKRDNLYKELQRVIVEDSPCLFMFEEHRTMLLQPYVEGFKQSPIVSATYWYDVSIEDKYVEEP
jgi:peptide/nickel transport system substrate-binding protein